jgi:hypothetical protein
VHAGGDVHREREREREREKRERYRERQTDTLSCRLVEMSDAKDAAHNAAQTADLIREEKAGMNEVKEAAYVNYNAGYVCTYI